MAPRIAVSMWPPRIIANDIAESKYEAPARTVTSPQGHPFRGSMETARLGAVQVSLVAATSHSVVGRAQHTDVASQHRCKLILLLFGSCILIQGGRTAVLNPGDVGLVGMQEAYSLEFHGAYRLLTMTFPRTMLRLTDQAMGRICANRVDCGGGLASLVRPVLRELAEVGQLEVLDAQRLVEQVIELMDTVLSRRLETLVTASIEGRYHLAQRILAYIEQRLADPALSPASIADTHHISRRYLYQLMTEQGHTVSGWIRRRRLEQCRRDLEDPHFAALPVSEVGALWGFTDAPHFRRTFKAGYGIAPSELRASRKDAKTDA
jgi:AraC-like DNA-binding protein